MDRQTLTLIIQIIVLVVAYILGRFILPNIPQDTIQNVTAQFNLMVEYADKFVSWAKWFKKDSTGAEKMNAVVEQLALIADRYGIDLSEDEIKAIAQKAYDKMMEGIQASESQKVIAEAAKESAANAANTANIVIPNVQPKPEIDPGIIQPINE